MQIKDLTQPELQFLTNYLRSALSSNEKAINSLKKQATALYSDCDPVNPNTAPAFREMNYLRSLRCDIVEQNKKLAGIQGKLKRVMCADEVPTLNTIRDEKEHAPIDQINITLQQWLEMVQFKITEGGDTSHNGTSLVYLDHWNYKQDGYSSSVTFDPTTQQIVEVEVCDYKRNCAYRRSLIDHTNNDAWDGVKWCNLDIDDDFLEKATAIVNGKEYDTRVVTPFNIPDDVLFKLLIQAHQQDITFNEYVGQMLQEYLGGLAPISEHEEVTK